MHNISKKALIVYYNDPNRCTFCNEIIQVPLGHKPAEIRKKRFCNRVCMGKSHAEKNKTIRDLKDKNKADKVKNAIDNFESRTKIQLFSESKNWQSARSFIQKRARLKYRSSNKPKECKICKYSKHYEVCHIKSVSSFNDDCLISEINDIENLIALCPNCHWEFDNNLLTVEKILEC